MGRSRREQGREELQATYTALVEAAARIEELEGLVLRLRVDLAARENMVRAAGRVIDALKADENPAPADFYALQVALAELEVAP